MISPNAPTARAGRDAGPRQDEDWPAQFAGSVERVVGTVRQKTTEPAMLISRGVVYGTFAGIVAIAVLVLTVIVTVRLLDNYLPSDVFGTDHTWLAHLIVSLPFLVGGVVLWRKGRRPS